ncbi:hypothetical protein EDD85DRAFT_798662 [Armillaria nabsnona]|nr:hypothetical protein EDD85DRAFT_798662 [Armillaria nabsnona]
MLPAALALLPVETTKDLNGNGISAHDVCLQFEKSAPPDNVVLIHARILGYMIIHSPSSAARHEVVKDHAKMSQPGQTFINYFIRPFKKPNRTPDSSDPPSPPPSDEPGIQEALKAHKEAKDLALVRDGFRPWQYEVLEVLKYGFGYDVEPLHGAKVHSLYNVMAMERNAYQSFNRLEIWFEKTKVTNCYKLRCVYALHPWPTEVTFTTPDNENLPTPSEPCMQLVPRKWKLGGGIDRRPLQSDGIEF